MMKSPYLFVVTCSKNYLFGLNALLNGLDYYENTADVHVLWFDSLCNNQTEIMAKEFFEKLPNAGFNFNVKLIPLEEVFKDEVNKGDAVWQLTFGRWLYMKKLATDPRFKTDHVAVSHLGADVMCWDNVMDWFEVAEKTDFIIVGRNALGSYSFHSDTVVHTNDAPFTDFPCIANIQKHWEALYRIYQIGCENNVADMPALYFAFKERQRRLIMLPDNLWIRNYVNCDYIWKQKGPDNKYWFISSSNRHRISMIHGKYWIWSNVVAKLQEHSNQPAEILKVWDNNLNVSYWACQFFNTQHKLKLTWQRI